MGFLAAIIGKLFEAAIGGWLEHMKEKRRESDLKKLGHSETAIAEGAVARKIARRALAVHGRPVPRDVDDILGRL